MLKYRSVGRPDSSHYVVSTENWDALLRPALAATLHAYGAQDCRRGVSLWRVHAYLPGVALDHVNAVQKLALQLAALVSEEERFLLQAHCIAHEPGLHKA